MGNFFGYRWRELLCKFYNFQQYATHLNVLIIPKKLKLKWKWTTFGSTHIMRENWKNYVFILWEKKRKVWWHFKQCHAVKSKSQRSGNKKKTEIQTCFLSHIPSFQQNKALQYDGQAHRCPMKLSQTQIFHSLIVNVFMVQKIFHPKR